MPEEEPQVQQYEIIGPEDPGAEGICIGCE